MDAVDRPILAELQQDGRMTLTELAEQVGLSL
jgi:DNA-binding Lrp family transcriptional regulator